MGRALALVALSWALLRRSLSSPVAAPGPRAPCPSSASSPEEPGRWLAGRVLRGSRELRSFRRLAWLLRSRWQELSSPGGQHRQGLCFSIRLSLCPDSSQSGCWVVAVEGSARLAQALLLQGDAEVLCRTVTRADGGRLSLADVKDKAWRGKGLWEKKPFLLEVGLRWSEPWKGWGWEAGRLEWVMEVVWVVWGGTAGLGVAGWLAHWALSRGLKEMREGGALGRLPRLLGQRRLPVRLLLEWGDSNDLPHSFWEEFNRVEEELVEVERAGLERWDLWGLGPAVGRESLALTQAPVDLSLFLSYALAIKAQLPPALLEKLQWRDLGDMGYSTYAPLRTTEFLGAAPTRPAEVEADTGGLRLPRLVHSRARTQRTRTLVSRRPPRPSPDPPTASDPPTEYHNHSRSQDHHDPTQSHSSPAPSPSPSPSPSPKVSPNPIRSPLFHT